MKSVEALTILLAEDDPGHAELVQRNLKRAGFENRIIHVTDGQQALDYLYSQGAYAGRQPNGPTMLLLDIKMPRVDGIEVLRTIKADRHLEKLPVIMLTTTDDPREIDRCYELGCSVYITKPLEHGAFVDAIQRLGLFLQVITIVREDQL